MKQVYLAGTMLSTSDRPRRLGTALTSQSYPHGPAPALVPRSPDSKTELLVSLPKPEESHRPSHLRLVTEVLYPIPVLNITEDLFLPWRGTLSSLPVTSRQEELFRRIATGS